MTVLLWYSITLHVVLTNIVSMILHFQKLRFIKIVFLDSRRSPHCSIQVHSLSAKPNRVPLSCLLPYKPLSFA